MKRATPVTRAAEPTMSQGLESIPPQLEGPMPAVDWSVPDGGQGLEFRCITATKRKNTPNPVTIPKAACPCGRAHIAMPPSIRTNGQASGPAKDRNENASSVPRSVITANAGHAAMRLGRFDCVSDESIRLLFVGSILPRGCDGLTSPS